MSCRNALLKPPRNFDANYLEVRMREHREWQERETERLADEAIEEITHEREAICPENRQLRTESSL